MFTATFRTHCTYLARKYRLITGDTNCSTQNVRGLLNILYGAFVKWKFLHNSAVITFNTKRPSTVSEMQLYAVYLKLLDELQE
jgi:hypothetical protein